MRTVRTKILIGLAPVLATLALSLGCLGARSATITMSCQESYESDWDTGSCWSDRIPELLVALQDDYASYPYSDGSQQVADIRFPGGERQFGCLSLAGVISGATVTYPFWEVDTFSILE